jgi:hypothetical protein
MKRPTDKQCEVLNGMLEGQTFREAYEAAGLSPSMQNTNAFLMRLVDNGYIILEVAP